MKFEEMKVIEKSIVPIYEKNCIDGSNFHEPVIDARELWAELGSKQEFANWIIESYGFQEGSDYRSFDKIIKRPTGATTRKEYLLTMDTAKEIAMVENNEKGRMVRRYFIEAEKRYRELKIIRARSKAERRLFTDILKEVLPESPHKSWRYKQFTDLVYKHVTGYNAKQLREMYDKPKDFNVRELLTPQQLREVVRYEGIIQGLLQLGQDYDGVKAILNNPAAFLPKKSA